MARDFDSIPRSRKSRTKYYVVFEGREPGIYFSWEEANARVYKFSRAKHKAFDSLEKAREAFENYQNGKGVRLTLRTDSKDEQPKRKTVKRRQAVKIDDLPPWELD
ncbi:RNase H1/viroplasmin domain-containing protein [Alteromonas oceani]|uniref:RNase H1/viroplasmin domain-containing protein n=1 Tax=Alteromonas oceani TaxID=2071609 RepID=A0ABV7K2J8_9ALTE|nr:RNase H1/viroplasmin domain-containing protein [Alteromonas oceani]